MILDNPTILENPVLFDLTKTGVSLGLILLYAFRDFSNVFVWLLTVRITIFWFPNLYWWEMPWYVVVVITDPYLRMWRGLFPGVFGLDLSTILAFMFVQYLQGVIERGIISTLDVLAGMMSLSL